MRSYLQGDAHLCASAVFVRARPSAGPPADTLVKSDKAARLPEGCPDPRKSHAFFAWRCENILPDVDSVWPAAAEDVRCDWRRAGHGTGSHK